MPRQSKLRNKQIRERILNYVRAGTPFETAARASGIGESTLHLWRQRGSEASERRKKGARLGPNDWMYLEFLEEIKEAEALAIADKISLVAIHGKNSWQAAAWFLERRRPEEWGRREFVRQEVSGPEGQPVQTETRIGPFPIERLDRTYRDKIRREVAAELRETTQRKDDDDDYTTTAERGPEACAEGDESRRDHETGVGPAEVAGEPAAVHATASC